VGLGLRENPMGFSWDFPMDFPCKEFPTDQSMESAEKNTKRLEVDRLSELAFFIWGLQTAFGVCFEQKKTR
jgi:hypothetical protein